MVASHLVALYRPFSSKLLYDYRIRALGIKTVSLKDFRKAVATELDRASSKISNKGISDGSKPNRYEKNVDI